MINNILICIVIIATSFSAITDFKKRKIYNRITFPLMIIGIILNTINTRFDGFKNSITGILFIFVLFFIISLFIRNIGFGDIKLFMGISGCIGYKDTLIVIFVASIIFIITNIILNKINQNSKCFNNIKSLGFNFLITREINEDLMDIKESDKRPFGPAIFIACLIVFTYLYLV